MSDFAFQGGQAVVFAGDSITDCGHRAAERPYGNGYVRQTIDLITARYPERGIRYFNEGIGGNTVRDLRHRWHDDVLRHEPDWLTVKIGINDLHRTLRQGPDPVSVEEYEELYHSILTDAKEQVADRIVLIDPFYLSTDTSGRSFRSIVLETLPSYIAVVGRLAEEFGARRVRTHELCQAQLQHRPPDDFCPEPVHPNTHGHLIIAHGLLAALNW